MAYELGEIVLYFDKYFKSLERCVIQRDVSGKRTIVCGDQSYFYDEQYLRKVTQDLVLPIAEYNSVNLASLDLHSIDMSQCKVKELFCENNPDLDTVKWPTKLEELSLTGTKLRSPACHLRKLYAEPSNIGNGTVADLINLEGTNGALWGLRVKSSSVFLTDTGTFIQLPQGSVFRTKLELIQNGLKKNACF